MFLNQLNMFISDPGVCYDESETCAQFAQEGKCTNSAKHEFANYCKKSCDQCGTYIYIDRVVFNGPFSRRNWSYWKPC